MVLTSNTSLWLLKIGCDLQCVIVAKHCVITDEAFSGTTHAIRLAPLNGTERAIKSNNIKERIHTMKFQLGSDFAMDERIFIQQQMT